MSLVRTFTIAALLMQAFVCAPVAAIAQERYPAKNIRMIVGLPPGGLADIAARLLAPGLGAELGQSIVVENVVGAGGTLAAQQIAGAAPDGYTIMLALDATMVIVPALRATQAPFDPIKQFTPIGRVLEAPLVIFAHKDFEGNTIADLVRLARAGGGRQYFYGTAGVGSSGHLIGEYLRQLTGAEMTHVPYRGAADALQDTVSGRTTMMISTAPAGMEFVKAGALKVLGNTGNVRTPELPDVPTFAESGVPALKDFNVQAWAGIFAPPGTPPAIVARVNEALRKVLGDRDLAVKFRVLGVTLGVTSPEAVTQQITAELDRWRKVGRDGNISLQ